METEMANVYSKDAAPRWAIPPLVPKEVYTDREEHIEYLYNAAKAAIGRREVESFLHKSDLVREAEGEGLKLLRLRFFAHDGFTEEAKGLMKEKGDFWSTREDLDGLLDTVGLRQLPDLGDGKKV